MDFFRGGETVTIKRRTPNAVDEYGNRTFTTTTIVVRDVFIGFSATGEPIDPTRNPVDAALTLYLPNDTAIQDGDRFLIRGSEWVKDGMAQDWVSPFNFAAGTVVQVRKRNG